VNRPGGLAVHPLALANGAHPTESAFILRGKRVRQRLLCEVSGAVPANAQAEASTLQLPANPTARERAQAIEARPACAGCHVLLNPAGLAYEGYDAVGNPRTAYASGRAIDTAVVLPLGAGSVQAADPGELGARLAQEPQAQTCLARQLYRFTFSMADAPEDACGLQGVTQVLRSGGTLEAAVLAMVTSPAFTRRSDP
jgi:hypothetical protein